MSTAAQRTMVIEIMDGTSGSDRTVTANLFGFGAFDGQPDMAKQAMSVHTYTHRFDVEFTELGDHEASPLSAKAGTRIVRLGVSIPIWTHTKTTVEETARRSTLASIESDAETAIQALHFRDNMSTTSGAVSTNIVGGLLSGPGGQGAPIWTLESAEWDLNLIKSRIDGEAVITITQATS